ncbi:MAG: heparinase II/III family protein, partial [Gemmatimonadota bacterium]
RAESTPESLAEERSKARYAKALAFAYLMTEREAFARRAVGLLLDMKFPPRGGDLGQPHEEGETVALYAAACDMLHPFLTAYPDSLAQVRTLLAEEAERLYEGIVIQEVKLGFIVLKIRLDQTPDPRDPAVTHLDNWHIRAYAGLGLAALALADHPGMAGHTPLQWADRADDLVMRSLEYQVDPVDGAYAEGPFYARYAADVYLPYLLAVRRLAGVDRFGEPLLRQLHDWSLDLRMPNGRRPNFDDSQIDDFYGHYLAGVTPDGGQHRWDWESDAAGLYVRGFSEMDAIALFDDSVPAVPPSRGPTLFLPEGGEAVFRSDWSPQATYLLLLAEHGNPRFRGLSHEHPDETSFILYAHGEMLALDGGYISFENHAKVNAGRSHNVVLVDGTGPPLVTVAGEALEGGNDAYLEDFYSTPAMDYAEVRAAYGGVQLRRRVMFPGHEYFAVGDEIRADAVHHYEWRLHGNGGGTSGGAYARQGSRARWTRATAELLAYLPEQTDRAVAEVDTVHSFDYGQELTHTVLQVRQSGQHVEYLSVLYPRSLPDGPEPALSAPAAAGGQAVAVALGNRRDVVWIAHSGADTVAVADPAGTISSNGRFGLVRRQEGRVTELCLQDGRFLVLDGDLRLSASTAVDVSLTLGEGRIEGFARGPEAGYQLAVAGVDAVGAASFADRAAVPAILQDGFLVLSLAGSGRLVVTGLRFAGAPPILPVLPGDFDGSGLVDLADFFLFADHFGQAAAGPGDPFDLDGDGQIDFQDFYLFADAFGSHLAPGP